MVRSRMRRSGRPRAGRAATALLLTLCGGVWLADAAGAARMKSGVAKARYRAVLTVLADGDREAALEALYEFETEAVGEEAPWKEIDGFWRQKLRVIRDLVLEHPLDLLVPVIALHHDAYEMYRERNRPLLASHSRTMASELAEIYADRAGGGEAGRFAAWVLISFGSYLQESWSITQAAHFLDRALKLDPANRFALLSLAVAHEKNGEYEAAVGYLDRLLAIDRDDPVIRLRRALCLPRAHHWEVDTARAELARLSESSGPAWVRSVAFQELARSHQRDGAVERAQEVLRRGLEVLPGDQQLSIQLAALLQRSAPSETRDIVAALGPGEWGRDSPRQMYDRWPSGGLEAARAQLRAMMQDRLASLAGSLRTPEPEGEAE